jgi:hypothetical protein
MATPRHHLLAALAAVLLGWALTLAAVTTAQANPSVEAAEALARNTFYEGVPAEDARALESAGIERLIEMLGDPDEAPHHAQILEVLGMTGRRGVYAAVSAAAAEEPTGEVDRDERRKRVAVLVALGHLARRDDRALADLQAAAQAESAATPSPRHAARRGAYARLGSLMRRSAVSALANSGRAEAHATLRRLAAKASDDPEFERHLRSAIRRLERERSRATGSGARSETRGRGVER